MCSTENLCEKDVCEGQTQNKPEHPCSDSKTTVAQVQRTKIYQGLAKKKMN